MGGTVGDIMSTVEDILGAVGVFSTVGGYLEYRGGVQYCDGKNLLLFEDPTVLNTPAALMYPPRYSNLEGWYPPRF